jgi:ABC-type transporter Mla MlaB component
MGIAGDILCLLVSVDDVDEVDSSAVYLLLEHRKHSFRPCQYPRIAIAKAADSL